MTSPVSSPFVRGHILQIDSTVIGGVSDYLAGLEQAWRREGVQSRKLAISEALCAESSLLERIDAIYADGARPDALILHFSGYGYGKRGICFWLIEEIQRVKAAMPPSFRLVILFHEIYASGPPWRSAFWVSPLQRLIARRLAVLADAIWTTTQGHAEWLQRATRNRIPVLARPVFSNIPVPDICPPLADRQTSMVVFGSEPTRRRAFEAAKRIGAQGLRLGVTSIIEAGGGQSVAHCISGSMAGLPVRFLGRLPEQKVSELLLQSRFALIDYPSDYLSKSGVFAAYAGHACVVLNTTESTRPADGIAAGTHYLSGSAQITRDDAGLQKIGDAARAWYLEHKIEVQAHELLVLAGIDESNK